MAEDPSSIRADIADTRERLSNTIEEIGERLNPQVLKENVKDSIREATIGRVRTMARQAADTVSRTTSGVTTTVRDNPIPMAMVAIGMGWMIWNARADRQNGAARARGVDMGYGPDYGTGFGTGYGTGYAGSYEGSRDASYGGSGGEFADRARQVADTAKERAQHLADDVRHRAQDFYGSAQAMTRRGAMRVEDSFQQNPLAIGAVAMAIGIAAGLAAPVSDREVRWMGDARDDLVDRVKDIAEETREKAEHVASRAANEAKIAAREEGLA